ncbi:DUF3606 domain-containing protein [Variovorax sp. J22P168]|nr:DUF3606 domain-containing protein [Variovorax sp. J22P168]MDM0013452.1 DUF3606 domain-containing protein [Variovorax sp. J22P168]
MVAIAQVSPDPANWMLTFGCSEAELQLAVRDVGDRVEDVRARLSQRK